MLNAVVRGAMKWEHDEEKDIVSLNNNDVVKSMNAFIAFPWIFGESFTSFSNLWFEMQYFAMLNFVIRLIEWQIEWCEYVLINYYY